MSNRVRVRRTGQQQRPRPAPVSAPGPRLPGVRSWLPATLAVPAEVGHLAAAWLAWPGSAGRGAFHAGLAALLGLVAVLVSGRSGRPALAAGAAVALVGPGMWLTGQVANVSPYAGVSAAVAVGTGLAELALAAVLLRLVVVGGSGR